MSTRYAHFIVSILLGSKKFYFITKGSGICTRSSVDRATDFLQKEPFVWKVEKIISKGDYNYAVVKDHPNASKHGYVLHHRIVMENHLGRILNSTEVVHHKNGNKKDNSLANLELMLHEEHARLHAKEQGRQMIELKCPQCGSLFKRRKGQTFLQKKSDYTACSRSCSGKFSRHIQLHGETAKVEAAISGNIVREFISHDNPEVTDDNQEP